MPYIQEPIPVVSDPPMREWYMLQLPWSGEVTEIRRLNMPDLQELYCDGNPLTALPWDELQNLYSCYAGDNYDLETVDAHDMPNLGDIDVYYCQSLTTLDISGCTNLSYIYAYGCAFDQAMVDQLLADLVANGATNGYLRISSGSSAPPSDPDGLALKAILIDRGWSIYHN